MKDQLKRQYELAAKGAAKAVAEQNEEDAKYFLGIMTRLESVIFPGRKMGDDSGLSQTPMR